MAKEKSLRFVANLIKSKLAA